jgi:membrane-associated HD superfamily phosphohydrolase
MINRLVDAIVDDNQLDESDITFSDIRLVKESFLKILTGIFHRRIDYPGYDFKNVGSESEGVPAQDSGSKQAKAV